MPRMHVVQIITRPCRACEVSFVSRELQPFRVLIEGGRLFSERIVEVVGDLRSGLAGDQARSAQVVEVEVAALPSGELGGEEEAVAVDVVFGGGPEAAVVGVLAKDFAAEVA